MSSSSKKNKKPTARFQDKSSKKAISKKRKREESTESESESEEVPKKRQKRESLDLSKRKGSMGRQQKKMVPYKLQEKLRAAKEKNTSRRVQIVYSPKIQLGAQKKITKQIQEETGIQIAKGHSPDKILYISTFNPKGTTFETKYHHWKERERDSWAWKQLMKSGEKGLLFLHKEKNGSRFPHSRSIQGQTLSIFHLPSTSGGNSLQIKNEGKGKQAKELRQWVLE